ncbi:MAG: 4Fe-4S dicluster domain-containing protein [Acidimicrobiia bacterium]|nr:4Fe-4S dicluster domain-containing protein [Acidimicrobiia bacterium]
MSVPSQPVQGDTARDVSGWITDFRPTKDELDACVHCGLCLPHCPTFRLTGNEAASPRGRITAMRAVNEGVLTVDEDFEEMLGFCLGCRACEAVCPGLVPYGRLFEGARAEIAAQRPTLVGSARRRALGRLLPLRRLVGSATTMAGLLQKVDGLLPNPLRKRLGGLRTLSANPQSSLGRIVEPEGTPVGTVGLLSGCVMDPWFGGVHEASIALLSRAGYRVVVPRSQTCCGALAAHDGAAEEARRLAAVNQRAFAGVDVVVADAAGCSAHLADYDHFVDGGFDAPTRDITVVIAEAIADGRLPRMEGNESVAYQDPCHLRHAQRITEEPRSIVRAAGYEAVEIDPDGICCGAAGLYTLLRPVAADELGKRKADQVRATGMTTVVSANPGCEMQLRSHLGDSYRIVHPVELYHDRLVSHANAGTR